MIQSKHLDNHYDSQALEKSFSFESDPRQSLPQDLHPGAAAKCGLSHFEFTSDQNLSLLIKAFDHEACWSVPEVLFASFATLLYRYTNENKLVIGWHCGIPTQRNRSISSNASRPATPLPFVPVQLGLDRHDRFTDVLKRLRDICDTWTDAAGTSQAGTEGNRHSESLSLSSLSNEFVPARFWAAPDLDKKTTPNTKNHQPFLPDSACGGTLALLATTSQDRLRFRIVYEQQHYHLPFIHLLAEEFDRITKMASSNPAIRLFELCSNSPRDEKQLKEWSLGDRSEDTVNYRHLHFHRVAKKLPDQPAVIIGKRTWTYEDLDLQTNRVANFFIELGVEPETPIGVMLPRSLELVIAYLAVLKTGATLFPIALETPPEKLKHLLNRVQPKFVLSRSAKRSVIEASGNRAICLDELDTQLALRSPEMPNPTIRPDSTAILLTTSGSTGQPKLVKRAAGSKVAAPMIASQDRHLLKSHSSTTFTIAEIFRPLTRGSTLYVAPDGLEHDPALLVEYLAEQRITHLISTPSHLRAILQLEGVLFPDSLKEILCSGENVLPDLRQACSKRTRAKLVIMYGCTESPGATSHTFCPDSDAGLPEVGRPNPEAQVYVLAEDRSLCGIGVPGEIFLGGNLSTGYHDDEKETEKRFIRNPFQDDARAQLFRTGDRGRWLPHGSLEILGRTDRQVQIRGYRVELAEIEIALAQHPGIREAVVMLQKNDLGHDRLVAYCVTEPEQQLDASALRKAMLEKLAIHMVPSSYVTLDRLPLTSNGKIDYQSLRDKPSALPTVSFAGAPPKTQTEIALAEIWKKLLSLDQLGIDDDFFEVGGHSLLALPLFTQIQETFQKKLPLAILLQHGTIRKLASHLDGSDSDHSAATVLELQRGKRGQRLFLLPSIGGELLLYRTLLAKLDDDLPISGIQPKLSNEKKHHFTDFQTTARHFVDALREQQPNGPYALLGFSYGGLMAFEIACQLSDLGEEVNLLALIDVGPGRSQTKVDATLRLARFPSITANVPGWIREEWRYPSKTSVFKRGTKKIRHHVRRWVRGQSYQPRLEDVHDLGFIPSQNHDLMRTVYQALRSYRPPFFSGMLTLYRAETRAFFGDYSHDLGWEKHVDKLKVIPVKGNHETILLPPHVDDLARQIQKELAQLPCPDLIPES